VALNLDEGRRRAGQDRLHHFRVALGSAAELDTALRLALGLKATSTPPRSPAPAASVTASSPWPGASSMAHDADVTSPLTSPPRSCPAAAAAARTPGCRSRC
jgi:hypothetical protein